MVFVSSATAVSLPTLYRVEGFENCFASGSGKVEASCRDSLLRSIHQALWLRPQSAGRKAFCKRLVPWVADEEAGVLTCQDEPGG